MGSLSNGDICIDLHGNAKLVFKVTAYLKSNISKMDRCILQTKLL